MRVVRPSGQGRRGRRRVEAIGKGDCWGSRRGWKEAEEEASRARDTAGIKNIFGDMAGTNSVL